MKGEELAICFRDNLAFLTDEVPIDLDQTNIPAPHYEFLPGAHWNVRVLNFIEAENKLFVEVLSYRVGEHWISERQIRLADELIFINKITFKHIDTSSYLKTVNTRKVINNTSKIDTQDATQEKTNFQSQTKKESTKSTHIVPFSIPIESVIFINGAVSFTKKIDELNKEIEFTIYNDALIEEYDAIKNYFESILQSKVINVNPIIILEDGHVISSTGTSPEIDKIDNSLITEVKFEFLNALRKKDLAIDKQLLTMGEYLEVFAGDEFKNKLIFKDETEMFNNVVENSQTKHYNHLRFLSSKHDSNLSKLRFIHKPFSFIFLLTSDTNFYIIWETLNTEEATYVWNFPKGVSINDIVTITDDRINKILKHGKNQYISSHPEAFNRIVHNYSDKHNGFKNWKGEIETLTF